MWETSPHTPELVMGTGMGTGKGGATAAHGWGSRSGRKRSLDWGRGQEVESGAATGGERREVRTLQKP